jgi:hypothetical protein
LNAACVSKAVNSTTKLQNYQTYTMTLEDLFELAFNKLTNEHIMLDLLTIDHGLGAKILAETGIDVTGFIISIDTYGIRHAIERHGDEKKEATKGQVALNKAAFHSLFLVLSEPESITFDPRKRSPSSTVVETLIFEKQIIDYHYVFKEIRRVKKKGKSNRLVFQTMFITKKRRTF